MKRWSRGGWWASSAGWSSFPKLPTNSGTQMNLLPSSKGRGEGHGAENPIALAFSMGTLDSAFQEAG